MAQIIPILKPSQIKRKREAIKIYPDGREVCDKTTIEGYREYERRTNQMADRQKWICALCNLFMPLMDGPTFDHEHSRGHGGGFRDDRIEVYGEWLNAAVHEACNGRKGSKHYHWKDGKYIPVLRLTQIMFRRRI